jgi:hypothetical protein
MSVIDDLTEELRRLSLDILLPIRTTRDKKVAPDVAKRLIVLGDRFVEALSNQQSVPKALVGQLYFPFRHLLMEADHANDPEPLVNLAWNYEERLDRIFGRDY